MNQLTSKQKPMIVSAPISRLSSKPAQRLLVLVSGVENDLISVTRKVWELAETTNANIQFLGVCTNAGQESGLRRTLVTMSAMVNYDQVHAESEIIVGRDWVKAVKSRCQPGDMVVCFNGQRTGLLHRSLSQILQADLDVPIYILSGDSSQENSQVSWLARTALWMGFIAIVIGFFILQINIYQLAKSWTTPLELISTALEFWLIWIWNNLFA